MLDTSFLALSDPTRRAILSRLALGKATVGDLAKPFALSQPAISQHLKLLEKAGMIVKRIDGQRRPCSLSPQGIARMEDWLSNLRRTLEASYQRLDVLLAETTRTETQP